MTYLQCLRSTLGGCLLVFGFIAAPLHAAEPNTLTPEELAGGWIMLFDGETTFGWQAASKADWNVADGVLAVTSGEPGLLCTTSEFADFTLQLDFRAPPETNSGVFIRTPRKPSDPKVDCYEINIATPAVSPFPTGSLVGRQKSEGSVTGDWQTLRITAQGGAISTELDGKQQVVYEDSHPLLRGFIGLQLNSGRVEFRNIKLQPLATVSLLNGKDLAGWKAFPDWTSQFSVNDRGELQVKNGPGALESEASFGDFILQLESFVNGKSLNSGVFFRSIPGEFCNGYEAQIHNGYKDGDRAQPVDCGTGGFYRRQNARRVVSDDFNWLYLTLTASGPHMAAWVNGYQVSDWTDTRAPNDNPRKGLRTAPGTLMIQGHDPTTDFLFRNLQAAELPTPPAPASSPAP